MEISLAHMFADLEDPRQAHKVAHELHEVLILAIITNATKGSEHLNKLRARLKSD